MVDAEPRVRNMGEGSLVVLGASLEPTRDTCGQNHELASYRASKGWARGDLLDYLLQILNL